MFEFLHPAWRPMIPPALLWLDRTLGYPFKAIDDGVRPDLEYADGLATALERREDFWRSSSEIPLALDRKGDSSVRIEQYLISFPKGFPTAAPKYPVLFLLHGSGGSLGRIHFKKQQPEGDTPFIVVKPTSPANWQPHSLNYLFSTIKRLLPIDEDRVYLRGSSMGGFGVYAWAMANPELFAAVSAISGGGDIFRANRLRNVPIWIFHGQQDDRVPIHLAETMVSALEACGASVKHTLHPEAKHSMRQFVDEQALAQWFLEHKRSREAIPSDPIDDFKLASNGVGQKEIVTLPARRLVSIPVISQQGRGRNRAVVAPLYEVFRRAGLRPEGLVQERIIPSSAEKTTTLVLELPIEGAIKDLPEGVSTVETVACRAYSFVIATKRADQNTPDALIASALTELKQQGESPTGEIRKTALNTDYGLWLGTELRMLMRIDIILK